ncbi:hypothetical protein [uncultured Thiohalocapsa sp.]|uniref:hypothetical protein n=1 Tax=uncultured Thiohalocapsa sp. TaxID=768990 RepID=UPI0025DB416E|nr:hypothetical protein [uncultured Thiohalocapsa sp.]
MRQTIVAAGALLALASMAQAVARTIDTAETTPVTISNGDSLTVTQSGSVITSSTSTPSITFDDTDVSGAIQIDGVVESTGDKGMEVDDVSVDGSIIINGSVTGTDEDAVDVDINQEAVNGSIINNGSITSSGNNNESGIEFDSGLVKGDLINNGTITSAGDNGITVYGDDDDNLSDNEGIIEGSLINTGTINAEGEAFDIDDNAWIKGGIENSGSLNSETAVVVEIDEETRIDNGLLNSGTIEGIDGIELRGDSSLNGGLVNSGKILAQDRALRLDSGTTVDGVIQNQSGGIMAGRLAIDTTVELVNSGQLYIKELTDAQAVADTGSPAESEIEGTYTQSTGGLLGVAVDTPETAGSTYSALQVRGDVTLEPNTTLQIDVKNNAQNLALGDRISDIITATGALNASTLRVRDNSAAYDFNAEINEGRIELLVVEQRIEPIPALSGYALLLLSGLISLLGFRAMK